MKKDKITFFYGRLDESSQYHWLPLCFPLLASRLDPDKTEIVVIDQRIEKENTLKLINEHVPDSIFFGISSFTGYQLGPSTEMARYVKTHFPRIPIVWGGPHVSALIEESLNEEYVDMVVAGRGDSVLPSLIQGLKSGKLDGIPGLYRKRRGEILGSPNCDFSDFGSLLEWNYELLKISEYINPETRILNMTTSWGCSNRCTFCFWYGNKNPWSAFSPERVYREVKHFKDKYGVAKIDFNESNYFNDLPRVLEIARLLKPLELSYWATARVDEMALLSAEDFKTLADSGLSSIFIGLESGSPKILKLMNKRIDLEGLVAAATNSRDTNITLYLSLLFQIPGERAEDLKLTYDYVRKLKEINPKIRAQTCSFVPLPNLPLTKLAMKHGFIPPRNMDGWKNIIKKSRFEKKAWLGEAEAVKYEKVFNELFSESQRMQYQ